MSTKPDEMGKSQQEEGDNDLNTTQSDPQIVAIDNVDTALAAKMHLVNVVCDCSIVETVPNLSR